MRRERARHLGDRLGQAGDGEAAVVVDERAAGRRERGAAEAGHARSAGIERAQLADERAGVQIAGRLAARQQQAHAQGDGTLEQRGVERAR